MISRNIFVFSQMLEPSLFDNRTVIEFWSGEGFYIGQTDSKDKPHGQGTMNFHENIEKKVKYSGNWKHGIIDGFGTMQWKNKDV